MIELATKRRGRCGAVVVALTAILLIGVGDPAAAQGLRPSSVFDVSPSLAIEAARTRLRLFTNDNPEPADGSVPANRPECPLISIDAMNGAASAVGAARGVDLRLQLDPWLARTTSDPELRPDTAPAGVAQGIPIVRCETSRPGDGQLTRPAVFAIDLNGGVTFGDVVRLYALEGVLATQPAGIGGRQVGGCLASDETSVCVALWSSRNLVIGMTLEGPPAAVNTSTAGAVLTTSVPTVINSLAVVTQPAPVCSGDTIRTQTGVAILGEPVCADGWAFATTVECPPPTTTATSVSDARLRSLRSPAVVQPLQDCAALDVFHVESNGWVYNGSIDVTCTENLTRLGMTVVTAGEVAPESCDDDDASLSTRPIRPDQQGSRVTALQIALVNLGYVLPVDGRYGPLTESAVVDFQERNGLVVDGVAGRQTQAALGI
jgi:hypothetical protein